MTMTEQDVITATASGDVDDLIFYPEPDGYISDR